MKVKVHFYLLSLTGKSQNQGGRRTSKLIQRLWEQKSNRQAGDQAGRIKQAGGNRRLDRKGRSTIDDLARNEWK